MIVPGSLSEAGPPKLTVQDTRGESGDENCLRSESHSTFRQPDSEFGFLGDQAAWFAFQGLGVFWGSGFEMF